ncbi:MAG: diacylglycerol kinase family lipid kinase [Bacteroidales bacterium]|nr:diacylglycerol kinase family lipid kinase [Bacteroidales bacterium]
MQDIWKVIVNPNAGSGRGSREWDEISNLLNAAGIKFSSEFSQFKYNSIDLVKQAYQEGYRKFIAVGGDGTIHEVVSGIMSLNTHDPEVLLAVIPVGTGNDWGREWGVTTDHKQAVDLIAAGHTKIQDLAEVHSTKNGKENTRFMVNIGGLGFDANVCFKVDSYKDEGKTGSSLYVRGLLRAFFGYTNKRFKVDVDGHRFYEGPVFSTAFGIGKFSGGGMMQTPEALPDDGLLEVTVIKKIPKLKVLFNIKKLYSGDIFTIKQVIHTKAKEVHVETFPTAKVEVDGEAVGFCPVSVTMLPHALRIIVP